MTRVLTLNCISIPIASFVVANFLISFERMRWDALEAMGCWIPRMLSVLRCIGCIWYYDASEATMYWMFRNVIMRSLSFNLISICPDQINSHYWLLQYPSSKIWSLSSRFRSQEHDRLNGKKNKNGNFRLWCLLRRNAGDLSSSRKLLSSVNFRQSSTISCSSYTSPWWYLFWSYTLDHPIRSLYFYWV